VDPETAIATIKIEYLANGAIRASWQNAADLTLIFGMLERAKMQISQHFEKIQKDHQRIVVPEMKMVPKNGQ
jgi:hypothetical protein